MKIVHFFLDYIDPSDSEQAKQYIIGIRFEFTNKLRAETVGNFSGHWSRHPLQSCESREKTTLTRISTSTGAKVRYLLRLFDSLGLLFFSKLKIK
jgi:hypothetical protein